MTKGKKEQPEQRTKALSEQQNGPQLSFDSSILDARWVERCAQAFTKESLSVEVLQDSFNMIGLYNFWLIPLGANEVLLEFENKDKIQITIAECRDFLEEKLTRVQL